MVSPKRKDEIVDIDKSISEENGIRSDLVDKLRGEISNSTYKIKSDKIAEKLAQIIREDESLKISNKLRSSSTRLK